MRLDQWLSQTTKKLASSGIGTARLDALVLLQDVLQKDKSYLLAHSETLLQGQALKKLDEQVERRVQHEPLAYIRGKVEFYGREFMVNNHVLVPRPESETMVALLRDLAKSQKLTASGLIVDVGTGSGCLAITAKLEMPKFEVVGTDLDANCLKVARQNARKHGAKIKFFHGDLLQPIPHSVLHTPYYVLANLPYVPDKYKVNHAVLTEPRHAVFGGKDGLDIYRRLFQQIATLSQKRGYVLTESLPFQHQDMTKLAKQGGYKLCKSDDFVQVFMG